MTRKIIHLDLDAFFCSVEELRDPTLRGKPFAVGGRPEHRGVVASCSYPARRYGIRSAMPMARALRLCPQLIVISGRHGDYSQASRQVMAHIKALTPLVEQISIDEAFMDVSDLPESGEFIARRLHTKILQQEGLPSSLGVATNKLMAKIATEVGKAANRGDDPPNAITVVPPGQEAAFLAPLPVNALWGVGPKTAERMDVYGLHTIGDVAKFPESELVLMFGNFGRELYARARGIDNRPVETVHETKSISQETTFSSDVLDEEHLRDTLRTLSSTVGRRLRQQGLVGNTVKIKLRWPDFTTLTRQIALDQGTDQDTQIFEVAIDLLKKNWPQGQPVRLIGVGVSGLHPPVRQLELWNHQAEKERRLQSALDDLWKRYGRGVVNRGEVHKHKDDKD